MIISRHRRTPKIVAAILVAFVALIGAIIISDQWVSILAPPKESSTSAGMPLPPPKVEPEVPSKAAPADQVARPASEASSDASTPTEARPPQPRSHKPKPKSASACDEANVAERDISCVFQDSETSTGDTGSGGTGSPRPVSDSSNRPARTSPSDSASIQESAAVQAVSERLDAMLDGNVGISAPEEVLEYEVFPLILRISAGNLETVLKSLHQEFPQNKTVVGGFTKLASRMSAHVWGAGLEVYPTGEVSQAISLQEPTTWRWQAKALQAGVVTITFTVVATPIIEGTPYPRNYYFERAIRVKVTPVGFIKQHWQWFASSIFIPAAIAAFAWMRRRRKTRVASLKKVRGRRLP